MSLGFFPQLNFYFEKHQNFGKDKRLVQQTACIPHLESPTGKILPHWKVSLRQYDISL